jgi:hypothetical protein
MKDAGPRGNGGEYSQEILQMFILPQVQSCHLTQLLEKVVRILIVNAKSRNFD